MPTEPASELVAVTSPLRTALLGALMDLGYSPTPNARGNSVLCRIISGGPSGEAWWMAKCELHATQNVIEISIILSLEIAPKVTPAGLQELIARLNAAIVFGSFFIPPGQDIVVFRTARDFAEGVTAKEVGRFLGQLNFPLNLWVELCADFPKRTDIQSRLDASLIRLGAHDGNRITQRTRRALFKVIRSGEVEPSPIPAIQLWAPD